MGIIRHGLLNRMILEGQLDGRRSRGRPRTTWTVNMFEWTGLIYSEAVRNAERRTEWRVIASNPLAVNGTR